MLLVDHQDSSPCSTLAGYFREAGAEVTTLRAGFDPALLDSYRPGLVVLSPGPGRPSDFGCDALLTAPRDDRGIAAFGVCLGMQAMVEHAGGQLGLLDTPGTRQAGDGCGCSAARPPPACLAWHSRPSSPPGGTTRCTPFRPASRADSRSRRSPPTGW